MGDYGFRISVDGKDVKTCDDLDTVVNSKYSNLKGSLSGNGNAIVANTTLETITIAHGLDYTPFAIVLYDRVYLGEYSQSPTQIVFGNLDYWSTKHRCDDTNLYIEIFKDDSNGTITVPYKYFISIDKGKL
jgi:hypothetical protein